MSEITKPSQITWAVYLFLGSLAIGLVDVFLNLSFELQKTSLIFVILVVAFTDAIVLLLIYKIDLGRNWARITFLVLVLIGLVPYAFALNTLFSRSILIGCMNITQTVMQIIALHYLFTKPGSTWFQKNTQTAKH